MELTNRIFEGCYEAERASMLSGVPKSTIYLWARKGVLTPTISTSKTKLWSYADLMGLRIVYWLRHSKEDASLYVPPSPMAEVRRTLERLDAQNIDIWQNELAISPLKVDQSGHIYINVDGQIMDTTGQSVLFNDYLDLLSVFEIAGESGPNLVRPRPHLQIVPGKCSGEPHIEHSRITTLGIFALKRRGFDVSHIGSLYPGIDLVSINEAIDLETKLQPQSAVA